nr:hypothetical protein [Bradyrhizobium sp. LTSPM299]
MPTRAIARRVGTAPSTVRLTIRRFRAISSAVQRRRRRSPVINSIRRYEPPSCLASSMAFAIDSLPTISSCQAVSQTTRTTARWGPLAGCTRRCNSSNRTNAQASSPTPDSRIRLALRGTCSSGSITAATPMPSRLPLLATGLAALGLFRLVQKAKGHI